MELLKHMVRPDACNHGLHSRFDKDPSGLKCGPLQYDVAECGPRACQEPRADVLQGSGDLIPRQSLRIVKGMIILPAGPGHKGSAKMEATNIHLLAILPGASAYRFVTTVWVVQSFAGNMRGLANLRGWVSGKLQCSPGISCTGLVAGDRRHEIQRS
jgi:hypothetical protein